MAVGRDVDRSRHLLGHRRIERLLVHRQVNEPDEAAIRQVHDLRDGLGEIAETDRQVERERSEAAVDGGAAEIDR